MTLTKSQRKTHLPSLLKRNFLFLSLPTPLPLQYSVSATAHQHVFRVNVVLCKWIWTLIRTANTWLTNVQFYPALIITQTPHSKHHFPAPSSKLCQNWLCRWRGTLYLHAAACQCCQHLLNGLGTNKIVEVMQHPSMHINMRCIHPG